MASASRTVIVLALAAAVAGCTVKKTEAPALSGPSELSLSLTVQASPDVLPQDGSSTAEISVLARDANGQPKPSVPLRIVMAIDGITQDFGKLSARDVVTNSSGRTSVTYTAPPPVDNIDHQTIVTFVVTPVGTDAGGQIDRSVNLRLVPPGVIEPPGGNAPDFTFTPDAPLVGGTVTFVATKRDDIASYAWDFGDGSTASGRQAQHEYSDAGSYMVTLNTVSVTGNKGVRTKALIVLPGLVPTAYFVYSPSDPAINTDIFFNGAGSTAGPGRSIVGYKWDFGDGAKGSGVTTSHRYTKTGTYMVTLVVTDDAGTTGTTSAGVLIGENGSGGVIARFTYSPTDPTAGSPVNFNATSSTSADPIASYTWDWGDGEETKGKDATVSHTFESVGNYIVTLTIKDSKGRTSTTSQSVFIN